MRHLTTHVWWLLPVLHLQATLVVVRASARPNILFILADDLGWADASFRGNPQIPTPNLDVLAASGIILNNYYVQSVCTPSRGALMTGLYPIHTGLQHFLLVQGEPWGLAPNFTIMPQYLKELGYATHMIGKWHLGYFKKTYTPTKRGFDSFYGYYNGGEDYYNHELALGDDIGLDFWEDERPIRNKRAQYSTRLFTQRAVSIIEDHDKAKPLFLYLAHQAVHCGDLYIGQEAPASSVAHFRYIKDLNRSIHAGAVYEMDNSVGHVIEALNRRGMLKNSIVVFSTDNGGLPISAQSNSAYNWPLRGTKATLWEGAVRGAAFVWSPLLSRVGRISNQMMHISDWLPTLYSAAGGDVSRLGNLDGKDMWEALSEGLPSPRHEVLLNIDPLGDYSALIVGNRKLVLGGVNNGSNDQRFPVPGRSRPVEGLDRMMFKSRAGAVLRHFYKVRKLTVRPNWRQEVLVNCSHHNPGSNFVAGSPPYYFDLQRDPCELHNLAATNLTELQELKEKLEAYAATMIPPANQPVDPKSLPKYHHGLWAPWR